MWTKRIYVLVPNRMKRDNNNKVSPFMVWHNKISISFKLQIKKVRR